MNRNKQLWKLLAVEGLAIALAMPGFAEDPQRYVDVKDVYDENDNLLASHNYELTIQYDHKFIGKDEVKVVS